jgi:AI-2 transport protein TqsA
MTPTDGGGAVDPSTVGADRAPSTAPADGSGVARSGPVWALAVLVLVLIAVLAVREVADLVVPIVFGLFLALVASPLIGGLERRGVRRSVALTATILAVLAVVVVVTVLIALSVGQLVVQLPRYEARITAAIAELRDLLAQLGVATDPDAISTIIEPDAIMAFVRPIAGAVSGAGAALFILVLTMVYALTGAGSMRKRAEAAFGQRHALLSGVERFGLDLRRYLIVRAQLGLFAAALVFVLLWVLGIPLPGLWAFLVFASSFIPNVGFILALIPPAILAYLDGGLVPALLVVGGFTLVNLLQDHLLQPVVMGAELNLSPLVVMLSVIAWTWILGAAGALLAVPLTVGLLALMEAFPSTRGVASLMRNRVDAPTITTPATPAPPVEPADA